MTPNFGPMCSANMVRWAGRASLVIMNQEENDLDTYTSKDSNNVSCAVLDPALGGAKLYNFRPLAKAAVIYLFETCFSTLLMDTTEVGKDAFMKITALGGVKLYKFTFTVKVAIISVLWEILIKLITTLIWQKRHDDQCTVMTGDISFLKTMNMYRGESNKQLQAEVQGVQGDSGQLDQVVGQDVVDRT